MAGSMSRMPQRSLTRGPKYLSPVRPFVEGMILRTPYVRCSKPERSGSDPGRITKFNTEIMRVYRFLILCVSILAVGSLFAVSAQEGSPTQRLEVLRQKLETIKRSAATSASVLKDEGKDD